MKNINSRLLILCAWVCFGTSYSQEVLTLQEAVSTVLQKNYGIVITNNNVKVAENNASTLNSGFLPTVTGTAGGTYNVDNVEAVFQNGNVTNLTGANSRRYNAGVNVDYTLFDGMGRKYNFEKLKETYALTELEARETVELTLLELFGVYYNIARITENLESLKQAMAISKDRHERAKNNLEYGQGSTIEVLNAEVDINTDSIDYFTLKQELTNAKHNLNLLLARNIREEFATDTNVLFIDSIQEATLFQSMLDNNVTMMQVEKELTISSYSYKANKSDYLPVISVNGAYGWNKNYNNQASFLVSSTSNGLSAGINLSWNIFDGGRTKTATQNSKIVLENQSVIKEQLEKTLERDFVNAWDTYQNKLFILKTQEKNLETSKRNFKRTEELNKVGRVNAIEFRQAQLNLLNAEKNKTFAKYDAKIAELQVLQISGQLLEVEL